MPELPEVETTRIGLTPHVIKKKITKVIVRQPNLRWLVPSDLKNSLIGSSFEQLTRRGKYLFFHTVRGRMMVHLGMSGSLRIVPVESDPRTHDHIDIYLENHPKGKHGAHTYTLSQFDLTADEVKFLFREYEAKHLSQN